MELEALSPFNRELLMQALPDGRLENLLYNDGARLEVGFARDRRCFALGERGWLDFVGWEGEPSAGARVSHWTLTREAQEILSRA